MKVLVVDDDPAKSEAIADAIGEALDSPGQHPITVVKSLGDAIRVMSLVAFDLIVLDLMLPYLPNGTADSRAGLELLRQLRSEDGPNKATSVIGISAFPAEISAFRSNFDELGVPIIAFDDTASWKRTLVRVLQDVNTRSGSQTELDFLVVCALDDERAGFARTGFAKVSEALVSGLNIHYFRAPGERELVGGIVRLSQMGLVAATFETASVLRAFRPRVLCMSGICAGFSKQASLGQLVVASPAWEYQAGKWSKNSFEIAPMQVPLRPTTRSLIDQAIAADGFRQYVEAGIDVQQTRPSRQSKPIIAPFATGSAVIADSHRLSHIVKQHRKVAALDMETFGFYFAAHESITTVGHYFAIKCVVDFADAEKADDLHSYGCIASARAAEQLIRVLSIGNK